MSQPISTLADILAPVTEEQFFRDYHGKKPLHIQGAADKLASVMSWEGLSTILNQTAIWSSRSLEMALDGKRIDPLEYSVAGRDRDNRDILQADMGKVGTWLRKGASLVANDITTLTPGVKTAAHALEDALHGKVQANLYCSWKAHPGFGSHFDTHDVFALHIAGEKTWKIYQCPIENPISHPQFTSLGKDFHEANKGPVSQTVTLKPGDVLYIPRGWYHDALATSEATMHIAFGVTNVIGLDLVSAMFERAVGDTLFRQSVPSPDNEKALASHLAALGAKLSQFTREPEMLERFAAYIRSYRYPRGGITLPDDALTVRYARRSGTFVVDQVNGAWRLGDGKKGVPVPAGMEAAVQWVVDRTDFSETEFAAAFPALDMKARQKLLNDLSAMKVIETA